MVEEASSPARLLFDAALERLGVPPIAENDHFEFDETASDNFESVYWLRGPGMPPLIFMLSGVFQVGLHDCPELIMVGEADLDSSSGVIESTIQLLTSVIEVQYAVRSKRMWIRILKSGSGEPQSQTSVWAGLGRWDADKRGVHRSYQPAFEPPTAEYLA